MSLNVLTLSTLFPDATRPNFGVFVERQTRELARRPDVTVTVVAPIGVPPWPFTNMGRYSAFSVLPTEERWKDLRLFRPRFAIIPGVGRFNAWSIARSVLPLIRRLHEETPFDVIDASFFYPDGPAAMRIADALGIPFSIKARGADIHHWARDKAAGPQIMAAADRAGGLLAVSAAMRKSMIGLGMDEDKIAVHYTGVDLDRFLPGDKAEAKARFGVTGPLLVSVGALIPRKGHELLIRSLPRLPEVTLLIAGEGPERTRLQELSERTGVSTRVGFLDAVPHNALPQLLVAADVMALPSSSEGLANAWVEALACGTPIVITDVGGARELVDRREAGRIVERDPAALVDGIRSILENPVPAEDVRATATRFTWAANAEILEAHLRGIVGK